MSLTEDTVPYELLYRFAADGTIQGCHFQMINRVLRDGEVISTTIGAAQPVLMGIAKAGIDPATIKEALNASAQQTIDTLTEAAAVATAAHDEAVKAKDEEIARLRIVVSTFAPEETEPPAPDVATQEEAETAMSQPEPPVK